MYAMLALSVADNARTLIRFATAVAILEAFAVIAAAHTAARAVRPVPATIRNGPSEQD